MDFSKGKYDNTDFFLKYISPSVVYDLSIQKMDNSKDNGYYKKDRNWKVATIKITEVRDKERMKFINADGF
jgi:hypothetical protein